MAILYVSYILTKFSLFHDAVNSSKFTKSVGRLMVKESNDLDRCERKRCWRVWRYRPDCVWREWEEDKEFH